MKSSLIWTSGATEDLKDIYGYISKDSEYYAKAYIAKIFGAVEGLPVFPMKGRKVPEFDRDDIREIIFDPYRIIYRIAQDRIFIVTVIHGKRDIEKERGRIEKA